MTREKDFKRLVRARMAKTGEAYTAARAQIRSKPTTPVKRVAPAPPDYETLAGIANLRLEEKTGCTWERWVPMLDGLGAVEMLLVRAERRQRHGGDPDDRAARRRPLRAAAARRPGRRAAPSPTGCSACSAPTPTASATTASPSCSCRSTRRASRCGRSRSSTARPASPRSSSTTRACRSRTGSAREGEGWKVAMATAGFERGLMLRSPARFQETARQLVALYRENERRRRRARCATTVVRCWMERRGLHARDLPHRVAAPRGRQDRRRGEPQQDLLVRARPAHARDRAAHPRRARASCCPRRRPRAASATGSTATSSRCRARSTPAPTRSSATSSPSASSACRGS